MATAAAELLRRARFSLADAGFAGGERFSDTDLFALMTMGLRDIIVRKPLALITRAVVELVEGAAQVLPDNGTAFISCGRNYGADGLTVGRAIGLTDLAGMDAAYPDWQNETADGVVVQAIPDPVRSRHFYVFPPQPDPAHFVELVYTPEITPIRTGGDLSPLVQSFDNAVVYYTCFAALQADSEAEANAALAKSFFDQYILSLGAK